MPPDPIERVVIISDIHMAAAGSHGMFSAGAALAAFIDHLAAAKERLELVILGDALDYLQVKPYLGFTSALAEEKTEAIVGHNREVFAALKRLLRAGKRLVWCIGNHDLELLFPEAQQVLVDALLDQGDAAARARLSLRLDGGRIDYEMAGGGRLRLVHGNKGDPWNRLDYNAARACAEAGGDKDFAYPPGSVLVARVLNPLKEQGFLHVDLLKPEQSVALPLTLALWPEDTRRYLKEAFPAFFEARQGGMKERLRRAFTGARPTFGAGTPVQPAVPATPEALLAAALRTAFSMEALPTEATAQDLTSLLGSDRGAKDVANALAAAPAQGKTFADPFAGRLIASALQGAAFNANRKNSPWSTEQPDEIDEYVRGAFGDGALVVVAGHTHLARAISYNGGYYLNTGTWADLMRIPTYFNGAEFKEHARELREYFRHPHLAPFELRPFRRLTYADVDLRATAGGPNFCAQLREWVSEPSRVVGQFP